MANQNANKIVVQAQVEATPDATEMPQTAVQQGLYLQVHSMQRGLYLPVPLMGPPPTLMGLCA